MAKKNTRKNGPRKRAPAPGPQQSSPPAAPAPSSSSSSPVNVHIVVPPAPPTPPPSPPPPGDSRAMLVLTVIGTLIAVLSFFKPDLGKALMSSMQDKPVISAQPR